MGENRVDVDGEKLVREYSSSGRKVELFLNHGHFYVRVFDEEGNLDDNARALTSSVVDMLNASE